MNTLKTTFLLTLMTVLLMAAGSAFGGRSGMMVMLVLSLGMNFFSYWYSDKLVLKMYGAREVTPDTEPGLVRMVANLAKKGQLPMPKVYIMETDAPNAFATGRDPDHAAVAVTTGIMRALNAEELEGVLGHELTHVKHRDTLISTIVASMAGMITMIGDMIRWGAIFGMGRSDDEDNGGGMIGFVAMAILAPLAAMLIQMGISRSREFSADEGGAAMCGNPLALASALTKIEQYSRFQAMPDATPATAHLFIINPLAGSGAWFMNLFSTHPPTSARVEKLQVLAHKMR